MFSRLQDHAAKIENDMRNIERELYATMKSIFSVVESDSTSVSFENLLLQLEDINSNVSQMIKENKQASSCLSAEFDKYWSYIEKLKSQMNSLEDYLENYGYVRNENYSLSSENNSNNTSDKFRKI